MFTSLKEILRAQQRRPVSLSLGVSQIIGGVAILFFVSQIVTGVLLLAYYRPTTEQAHSSLAIIVDEVRLGWLIRALHSWGAQLVILFSLLHLIHSYFWHTYERPRQLTWVTSVVLLILLLTFAFTGTLLPWDQYGYWAIDAARQTIAAIPILGNAVLALLWGGWEIGEEVLLRFYVLHIGFLPWMAAVFLCVHVALTWRLGSKQTAGVTAPLRSRPPRLVPDLLITLLISFLLISGLFLSLATFFPPSLSSVANPLSPLGNVQPPWYFKSVHQVLQQLPGRAAAAIIVSVFLVLVLLPLFDGQPVRSPMRRVMRWALGAAFVGATVWIGARG